MYEQFYGLREKAFSLTPDPHFLFLTQRSKEALQHILYGIERREGFALIVGDVGTGKTTLCWAILEKLDEKNVRTALVQNPMLSETEILMSILQDLGVHKDASPGIRDSEGQPGQDVFDSSWMRGMTKKDLLDQLNRFLAQLAQEDIFTVIIIDESQNLSLEMLEQLRLLSNLETAKKKFFQIIFVGQLELEHKLNLPALRQLNQRISIRFETSPLSREDTERYIFHRLARAGEAMKIRFGRGALKTIYRHSKGCPRLINLICDRALLAGFIQRSTIITRAMVRKAVRSLEGKEHVSLQQVLPGWATKTIIVSASLLLMLLLLSLLIWKGVVRLDAVSFAPSTAAALGSPPPPGKPPPPVTEAPRTPPVPDSAPFPPPGNPGTPSIPTPAEADAQAAEPYFLQVHSFRWNGPAEQALTELEKAGYQSIIRHNADAKGTGWFVVYVGPFHDLETAKQAASILAVRDKLSPIIRQMRIE